jgi:arsenite methyltransferase
MTGRNGKVYGLDMTRAMQQRLAHNIETMGITHAEVLPGNAEEIPLPENSIDVITSNGVINLVPDKAKAIVEMLRVLRPGGRVQIADIVIGAQEEMLEEVKDIPRLWVECIVGAVTQDEYFEMFEAAGFARPQMHAVFEYFSRSSKQETREIAESFRAHGILLTSTKPEG